MSYTGNFYFSGLAKDNYFSLLETDPSKAKILYNNALIDSLKTQFGIHAPLTFKEVETLIGTNKECRDWYMNYKLEYAFFIENYQAFEDLELTREEIQEIKESHDKNNKKRAEIGMRIRELAEKFAQERKLLNDTLIGMIEKGSPLAIIKFINTDHIPLIEQIKINRLSDVDEKRKATNLAVKEIKKKLINDIRNKIKIDYKKFVL